jgi:NAD(P)-dependent dehydrogenase (short-subunit alcohol dehydrogenase family)
MTMPGRVCLVTGVTSGIGQATAQALAGLGASVVILGRKDIPSAQGVAALVAGADGSSRHPVSYPCSSDAARLAPSSYARLCGDGQGPIGAAHAAESTLLVHVGSSAPSSRERGVWC